MTTVGSGKFTYEFIQDWPTLPAGQDLGVVSSVATDSQDRVYAFQRKDPPVMVFDRDGIYLNSWGMGAITDPHGINIVDDVVYITDRADHVAVKFTLDGKPLQVIGDRGVFSDTGCENPGDLCPRAAGPFNYCTELTTSPSGDLYVSDGYRNARVHRFSKDGLLINSWGQPGKETPGEFHLVHSLLVDPEGKVYVCDRTNRRVQIFSPEGQFITMWTGMGGPDNIVRDEEGIFYIAEQADESGDSHVSIWDGDGTVLERWPIRHAHGLEVDAHGDIYLGLTIDQSVDKYIRQR